MFRGSNIPKTSICCIFLSWKILDFLKQNVSERLPKQAFLATANRKWPVGLPIEQDRSIKSKIFYRVTWDFIPAKWWKWWKTINGGDLILNCCPHNPHGKTGNEVGERLREINQESCGVHGSFKSGLQLLCYYQFTAKHLTIRQRSSFCLQTSGSSFQILHS